MFWICYGPKVPVLQICKLFRQVQEYIAMSSLLVSFHYLALSVHAEAVIVVFPDCSILYSLLETIGCRAIVYNTDGYSTGTRRWMQILLVMFYVQHFIRWWVYNGSKLLLGWFCDRVQRTINYDKKKKFVDTRPSHHVYLYTGNLFQMIRKLRPTWYPLNWLWLSQVSWITACVLQCVSPTPLLLPSIVDVLH